MYLEIKNLSKTISKNAVLNNISIEMEKGKIYGLRGKNGSGKTMLMRSICGLIVPTEGEIVIDGESLHKDISFPRSIGALIETPGFISSYSGFKNLKILASIQNKILDSDIENILLELGLSPHDKKKFKKYSLGMKQKLGIAAAIMENPDIIILDEPINALDESSVTKVKELLLRYKKSGSLIIISCHDKEELEYLCDEIFCIENGTITKKYTVDNKANETKENI